MDISSEPRFLKLNRHLDFPLTSKINEESGVRDFINETNNGIIYIDKVGLEEIRNYIPRSRV